MFGVGDYKVNGVVPGFFAMPGSGPLPENFELLSL